MILYIPFFLTYGNALANSRNKSALIALGFIAIIYFIFGLALFLPSLALMVRRLRDAGFHWALIFILFVPLGSIVLLVLFAMPTKEEATPVMNQVKEVQAEEVVEAVEAQEVSPFEEIDKN